MLPRIPFSCVVFLVACGPAPLRPRDPTPGVAHFTIQTFNVYQNAYDDPATVEAIGAANADVICLQEIQAEWESAIRARYTEQYPNMLFHPWPGSDGLAVISRFPLEEQSFDVNPLGNHPAWHVVADTPMGPVQVLNLHLRSVFRGEPSKIDSYFDLSRDHSVEIQAFSGECAPGMPTIVAGDYNEEPTGSAIAYLQSKGYRNALPLFHPGQGTWRDPPAWQFEQTIDHIVFDKAFDPLNSWVELLGNSDHLPVVAHLQAAPP